VGNAVEVEPIGNLELRGFTQPMPTFRVVRVK